MHESDVDDLLLRVGTLLERDVDDFDMPTIAISHRYVAEWLESRRSGRFHAPTMDALKALASGCCLIAENDPDALTGYEAINAIALAQRAGTVAELKELERNPNLAWRQTDLGDWLKTWGKLDRALGLHTQALIIRESLAEELGTPKARRDLSVSLDRAGDMALSRGDLEGAEALFARSLGVAESLAEELGTPEARRDLSASLDRAGDMALRRGDLEGAEELYHRMSEILGDLATTLGTPQSRQEAAYAMNKLANIVQQRNALSENNQLSVFRAMKRGTRMATGAEAKTIVLQHLNEQGIKYSDHSDERVQHVRVGWTTDAMSDIKIDVFFDEDGGSIRLVTMLPLEIPEGKLASALLEVNRCNKQYRWMSFYLDDDRTVMGEIDAVIEPNTAGEEVLELIYRTLSICDDAYPAFMKLVWG